MRVFGHDWLLNNTKQYWSTVNFMSKHSHISASLITLFEAEQAVQMYICQWSLVQCIDVIYNELGTPKEGRLERALGDLTSLALIFSSQYFYTNINFHFIVSRSARIFTFRILLTALPTLAM